jgi:hypothetical protein
MLNIDERNHITEWYNMILISKVRITDLFLNTLYNFLNRFAEFQSLYLIILIT